MARSDFITCLLKQKQSKARREAAVETHQRRAQARPAGIKAAVCELPFGRVASAHVGGAGGTCVLRGCVPKKLMVFGGEFGEGFRDSVQFGCAWRAQLVPAAGAACAQTAQHAPMSMRL